ncbi:alkaline phosphatase family protein [Sphingomonas sp. ERG5]|uniref:alkaline phosphatase family protein n=1 Tax=Sphingomonas sp. ERG5 TaxID=1381597 RepID=UPI000B32E708|nr:ectonucleotide pyrophosphatase/phosphodiesterase [Sphingomonas sp. ERG5]
MVRFLAALAVLFAVLATPAMAKPAGDETLIVISIDGFRADYLERGLSPTLAKLARDGVRSVGMRPAFPSVTLPNHVTLMTGKTPDHHGVIDNLMMDPAIPGWFGGLDPKVAEDPRWWQGAKPLWITAEEQGVRSADMYWPGAQVPFAGKLPSMGRAPGDLSADAEVDAVLQWLDRPPGSRPRFVTLYFPAVDDAGHAFGPDSKEVNAAIVQVDAALARLVAGLEQRGRRASTNLVLMADHGMVEIPAGQQILIDDFIDTSKLVVTTAGAYIGVNPLPGHEAEVEAVMLKPRDHLTCWRKGQIPAHLAYGKHPRVPAIFCLAESGWVVLTKPIAAYMTSHYASGFHGNHGYDPVDPTMAALFVANGPAFRHGLMIPAFDNINVYPMLARVLGVKGEPGDGTLALARKIMVPAGQRR